MNRKLIAITALCAFANVGAHAAAGEQNPLPPQTFQSTLSRSEVMAGAKHPMIISNGGTGVLTVNGSTVDRAMVRAEAIKSNRDGTASYGEVSDRKS